MYDFEWIIEESKLPWLKLEIKFPYKKILAEAKAMKPFFVPELLGINKKGYKFGKYSKYKHKGWSSICIHGISSTHIQYYENYDYKSNKEVPYKWTDIATKCPYTYNFFKNIYPCNNYNRIRFMLLEPGGFITPHNDMANSKLAPVNIALNHPKNCVMKFSEHGIVPFKDGTAFLLDINNVHAAYNKSNEDRYHIIVHGNYQNNKKWKQLVENSYQKNGIK